MFTMFDIEKSALILIDVQGRLAHMMHKEQRLFKQINIMTAAAKLLDLPIFWLEQYPQGLGETVAEIKQHLGGYQRYEKITFSSCGDSRFLDDLQSSGKRQLIVTGIETHVCVYQTVLDLLQAEFQVAINQDAVSSRTHANKKLGLARMQQGGALITSTEMILFELMRTAAHPQFKQVSKLLK